MNIYPAQPLDLMQYINARFHEPFIHEKIEYSTAPDINRLIAAAAKLSEVFPLIKCRYDSEDNTFVELENFSVGSLFDRADKQSVDLLTRSLDTNEKLIEFTLCENVLYVTASHLICDGNGFKMLLYALCGYYSGRKIDSANFMNRDFSLLFGGIKTSVFKMLLSMLGGYKNQKIYEKTEGERTYIIENTIDAQTMESVHARARQQEATLNDVFMTAYIRAEHTLYGRSKINLPCVSDLRKYANGNGGIGNIGGTLSVNIKLKEN